MRNLHAEWRDKHRKARTIRLAQNLVTQAVKAVVAERVARLNLAAENLNQQSRFLELRRMRRR